MSAGDTFLSLAAVIYFVTDEMPVIRSRCVEALNNRCRSFGVRSYDIHLLNYSNMAL